MSTTNPAVTITAGRHAGQHGIVWDDRQGAATLTVLLTNPDAAFRQAVKANSVLVSVRRASLACEHCGWDAEDIAADPEWHAEHCAAV